MHVSKDLITKCLKQDRKAQNELYKACYAYLMRICLRYAARPDDAADFLNTGFIKILGNLDKYKDDRPFDLWMRRIMINNIIDHYRKNAKHRDNTTYSTDAESEGIVWNDAEQKLSVEEILAYINELPDMAREVFNLYVIDGYNHKEIGEMLEINEGTSKWHLNNARKKLQEKITKIKMAKNY